MKTQIKEIQDEVYRLGKMGNIPPLLLVVLTSPVDDGRPYVLINESVFSYISNERGYEIFKKTTDSIDELIYWILSRAISRMAMNYELENRVEGQDSRRIYFSKIIEVMEKISPLWRIKIQKEINEILKIAPYVDV